MERKCSAPQMMLSCFYYVEKMDGTNAYETSLKRYKYITAPLHCEDRWNNKIR